MTRPDEKEMEEFEKKIEKILALGELLREELKKELLKALKKAAAEKKRLEEAGKITREMLYEPFDI